MGFLDDLVRSIDKVEAGLNKVVDTVETAADKSEQLLGKVDAGAAKVTEATDKLVGSE
jgi:hypothetical protein